MLYCDESFSSVATSNYRVLIVEDSKLINHTIHKTLTQLAYSCDQAVDYETAVQFLGENSYDFIILDLNLPDAFGEDLVLDILRASKAKIIVLTAETDIQMREALFKHGVLDYIIKDKHFKNSIDIVHKTIQSIENNLTTNILVIDESLFMRKQITKVLNVRNYKVITVLTMQDGLEILEKENINLIILDIELPDKNGLDILRELKKRPDICPIPVISISGMNNPEIARESLKLGSFDYIKKPFNIEEFVLKVDLAITLNRKDNEIVCNQQVLSEYKDAVDRSAIVSKADLQGKIIFVNDKFCEISGYTREELIGQAHNIVRHPDSPSSIFKEMWELLQNKQSWHGILKNKKKNGEVYFVDTVINPIINAHGKIIEYIGIRTDITELELIKHQLENDVSISNENFHEAYKMSLEYQKAINQSNIVSRVDKNGIITYVNDAFIEISQYSKEELLGNTNEILRHPSTPKKTYKKLWETIESGNVWKGQLRSRAKDGSSYYVQNTIVPIFDKNDNILEYVSIMDDITDMLSLHKELEETQKEIIYKMGEVGETRSKETGYHVKRVAQYSQLLALLAGLSTKHANILLAASPMHDIGKVGIPDDILLKPGKFNEDEWEIMKTHAALGYNILKNSKREILKAAAIVAHRHHEKWDGSGYPNALVGEKIHIYGRITAVADVFDALGSDRVYKKAWELEKILDLFKEQRGKHFDPNLVDIFLNNLDKFLKIRDTYKD